MVNRVPETSNRCNGNVEDSACRETSAMAFYYIFIFHILNFIIWLLPPGRACWNTRGCPRRYFPVRKAGDDRTTIRESSTIPVPNRLKCVGLLLGTQGRPIVWEPSDREKLVKCRTGRRGFLSCVNSPSSFPVQHKPKKKKKKKRALFQLFYRKLYQATERRMFCSSWKHWESIQLFVNIKLVVALN